MYLCINFDKLLVGHCAGRHFERVLLLFAAAVDKQYPDVTKQWPYHDCSAISISHKCTNDIYVVTGMAALMPVHLLDYRPLLLTAMM